MVHQAGMSCRAASSSESTVTVPPTGTSWIAFASSMTGSGQRLPSESTTRPAGSAGSPGSSPAGAASAAPPAVVAAVSRPAAGTPSRSRTARTTCGSTSRKRSTSASSVPYGSETRTFPSDSTPIARSTWLGVRVLDVQDDPDDTENPARSSSCSSASPST